MLKMCLVGGRRVKGSANCHRSTEKGRDNYDRIFRENQNVCSGCGCKAKTGLCSDCKKKVSEVKR